MALQMTTDRLQTLSSGLQEAVRESGDFLRQQLGLVQTSEVEEKSLKSLVSYVDRQSEELLTSRLATLLPEAGFLTEEETIEQGQEPVRWIIDPLDGTTNFLHGIPAFCVSVALEVNGNIDVACVYEPLRDELFSAWRGGGTTLNGQTVSVSGNQNPAKALGATGFPYELGTAANAMMKMYADMLHKTRGLRRLGSAALDLAYTAAGRFDFFYEPWLNPWDVAAGYLLVKEAGGLVTDFSGSGDPVFGRQILASTPGMHVWLLEHLRASGMTGL